MSKRSDDEIRALHGTKKHAEAHLWRRDVLTRKGVVIDDDGPTCDACAEGIPLSDLYSIKPEGLPFDPQPHDDEPEFEGIGLYHEWCVKQLCSDAAFIIHLEFDEWRVKRLHSDAVFAKAVLPIIH